MQFTKMHGAGNDYVYVDCFREKVPPDLPSLARKISHRRFGVGADGLILMHPAELADCRMQMFNADGSEAEMCGNGIRCVAKYCFEHGLRRSADSATSQPQDRLLIETGHGILEVQLLIEQQQVVAARVNMGTPVLAAEQIPARFGVPEVIDQPLDMEGYDLRITCVSMGNPHCVVFVDQATDELVEHLGPQIEHDARFPARTNVEFVEVVSRQEARQRTWERGSGETWACGTGACATCVAGVVTGRMDPGVLIHLRGGDLQIEWEREADRVFLTGPAESVYTGEWPGTTD